MLKRQSTPEQLARFSRIATVVVGVVAFVLAKYSTDAVFKMVSFAWSGLAAAFAPQLVLTLWWKKTTGLGVLVGMIGGTLTVIAWRYWFHFALTERVGGVLVATLLVIAVSLWDRGRNEPA
jgi:sodium/proline symporter